MSNTPQQPEQPATTIKTVDNGPLQIKGQFQVVDHDGTVYETRRTAFLCRCGHSATKPFCDGTHNKIGFEATGRAEEQE
ncbi:CDGSH iron-sulfur domain-containing protein [Brevibacterium luteolum]|uniref:CDGSH iron-sulfur domain-containing protein n=1 Tax=Brevibacterium luteolum TaxID=199591 RepID=UPI001C24005F|nr:CDGSH iron-sulfur domain-containing protein [Brevibacterium luteolum]MBU8577620.1 CDGSH iron-sulfur domain-containing protein [Brevibacterium luteolum]